MADITLQTTLVSYSHTGTHLYLVGAGFFSFGKFLVRPMIINADNMQVWIYGVLFIGGQILWRG